MFTALWKPKVISKVVNAIEKRKKNGSSFTILAVAEGAISKEDTKLSKKELKEKHKNAKYPSVSYEIAAKIHKVTIFKPSPLSIFADL